MPQTVWGFVSSDGGHRQPEKVMGISLDRTGGVGVSKARPRGWDGRGQRTWLIMSGWCRMAARDEWLKGKGLFLGSASQQAVLLQARGNGPSDRSYYRTERATFPGGQSLCLHPSVVKTPWTVREQGVLVTWLLFSSLLNLLHRC